jgi:hypothetical protein
LKSASLSFATNDPDENPFQVNLSGIGGPAPDIASNMTSYSFGSVNIGSAGEYIFIVSNTGNADLNVTSTTITGIVGVTGFEFIIPSGGGPFTLAPGATRNLVVRFVPASAGNKTAQLSIASNDPDENPFLINLSGSGTSTAVDEALTAAPEKFRLDQNYPNPFNPGTTIPYALPSPSHVRLVICDLNGREVAVLVNGPCAAGWHTARWNGRDACHVPAPAGVYLVRLETPARCETRRLLLLK